jgi:enamine deaminase RidA (YjgF/YER057c/UK114 family)
MSGSPTSAIASGATIAPNAELIWISGVVAPDGTPPDDEAAAALGVMKERLAAMGVSMADVAELRVYRVADDGGDELSSAWNDAYGAEFNTEQNPHKPVRTNYLVESLPGGRHVEVEAIIVRSPGVF